MADSNIAITAGTGTSVDTRTIGSEHRQVIVVGDPSVNANVADVLASDTSTGLSITSPGLVVRLAGSATVTPAGGTLRVFLDAATGLPAGVNTLGSIAVFFNPSVPNINVANTPTITGITNSINIYLGATAGTIAANIGTIAGTAAVYFSPAGPSVRDISATGVIPVTVSGSTSTAGGSGANTLISPDSGRNIKIYAYSLTTTAQVHLSPRFTTGGSAGATELWRVALQAPAQGIAGANLAVQPPGYLFATGTSNTLALYLDSASLVHYSIAYFKESA